MTMKNRILYFCLSLCVLFSCEDDKDVVTIDTNAEPAVITSLSSDLTKIITSEKLSEKITFEWEKADYGVNTEVVYTVQIDSKCGTFESFVELGKTSADSLTLTLETLNSKLLDELAVASHQLADVQVRIVSTVNNKLPAISDTVQFQITPWSDKPVALWLLGGNWNAKDAPSIYVEGESSFEGYVYFDDEAPFKLATSPICAQTTYGDFGGKLSSGASGNILVDSGYYRLQADTENLTYSLVKINSWGMIGSSTPGGWNTSTPMEYNEANDVWKGEVELTNGALKFRANDNWDINFGPADINSFQGTLIQTNDAVDIAEPGTYSVTLDFSKSETPYEYVYTVEKISDVAEPAKLWIPGGYQASGGDPSQPDALTIFSVAGSNDKVFEGYVTIPSSTWIKFTNAPDWGHINYGSGGDGILTTDGAAGGIDIPTAGYYKISVDIENLTYSLVKVDSWGLVGDATPGSWFDSTPMDYDATTKTWSKTVNLINGALKFRANNAWSLNYGPADSNSFVGTLIQTDAAISIPEAGSYTVTIDLSRLSAPYQYTYSVVKN